MKNLIDILLEKKYLIDTNVGKDDAKIEKKMKQLADAHDVPGSWQSGKSLEIIAKTAKDIFKDEIIKIVVPYANFNCYGPAKDIYDDVRSQMPFVTRRYKKHISQTSTLFYGEKQVNSGGSFLPFQSYADEFYIKEYKFEKGIPTFYLVRYHESFM